MPESATPPSEGDARYEDVVQRLARVVERLEGGALSLEDSIARYEEGIQLSRRLTTVLDESEKRIERLVERNDATPVTEPMELSSSREAPEGDRLF